MNKRMIAGMVAVFTLLLAACASGQGKAEPAQAKPTQEEQQQQERQRNEAIQAMEQGDEYVGQGNYQKALEQYNDALRLYPAGMRDQTFQEIEQKQTHVQWHQQRAQPQQQQSGQIQLNIGGNQPAASTSMTGEQLQRSIDRAAERAARREAAQRGITVDELEAVLAAEQAAREEEARQQNKPFAQNCFNIGKLFFDQGKYDAAIREFAEAIDLYPDLAEARAYLDRANAAKRQ